MPAKYSFLPWLRQGIGTVLSNVDDLGSGANPGTIPRATIDVDLAVPGGTVPTQKVELVGPGDIIGLDSRNILRVFPEPNVGNFESNYFPFIEFYQDTICWDYTPTGPNTNDKRLRPWLFLAVLAEDEFDFTENPSGPLDYFKLLKAQAVVFPPHTDTWAWAHVHVNVDLLNNNIDPIINLETKLQSEPDFAVARLLCPRHLTPNTSYTAFVIPAFEAGRLAGLGEAAATIEAVDPLMPAWGINTGTDKFPVYHKWAFQTGPQGDFEYLVRSLVPRLLEPGVGFRDLDVQEPSPYGIPGISTPDTTIDLGGALRPVAEPYPDLTGTDVENFEKALADLLNLNQYYPYPDPLLIPTPPSNPFLDVPVPVTEEPIIIPPLYGGWHVLTQTVERELNGNVPNNLWLRTLNLDPRHRVAAGIGARVIQENQDKYMEEAWKQVGSILEANQLLRMSQLGIEIVTRLTKRHLPTLYLFDFLPLLVNMLPHLNCGHSSLYHFIKESKFPLAALDPAFQKIIRPRGRIRRKFHQKNHDGHLPKDHSAIAASNEKNQSILGRIAGNNIEWIPAKQIAPGKIKIEPVLDFSLEPAQLYTFNAEELKIQIDPADQSIILPPFQYSPLPSEDLDGDGAADPFIPVANDLMAASSPTEIFRAPLFDLLCEIIKVYPTEIPKPNLDIIILEKCVIHSFNPGNSIKKRTIKKIGMDVELDAIVPVMPYPDYRDPMYEKLIEMDLNLFLPGIEKLPNNTITLLEPNQEFIESYMVGLNQEMARELLWNEYPTDQRGSYFRQFWDVSGFIDWDNIFSEPSSPAALALAEELKDIRKIHRWDPSSKLGAHNNRVVDPTKSPLVLTIRGDLLKRYPDASIFAIKAVLAISDDDGSVNLSLSTNPEVKMYPIFTAKIDPDLTFFGFDLTSGDAKGNGTPSNPGWFFAIKEPPAGPRFGFDIQQGNVSPSSPDTWNDIDWGHVDPAGTGFADPSATVPVPVNYDDVAYWGNNSADIAYVCYQVPFMMAVHASEMLTD